MDKKNLSIGFLFIAAAIALMIYSGIDQKRRADEYRRLHPEEFIPGNLTAGNLTANSTAAGAPAPGPTVFPTVEAASATQPLASAQPAAPAALHVLQNDDFAVTFTEDGGAIQSVALKKFAAHLNQPNEPVIFNEGGPPALGLSLNSSVPGSLGVPPVPIRGRFTVDESKSSPTSLTFMLQTPQGFGITRTYTIQPDAKTGDPYLISHKTTFTNHSPDRASLKHIFVNAGTPPPTPGAGSIAAQALNFGYYDGNSAKFIFVAEFQDQPAKYFGLKGPQPKKPFVFVPREGNPDLKWVSVKDQFFAAVLTPVNVLGSNYYATGVTVTVDGAVETSLTGDMEFDLGLLPPGQSKELAINYYIGPKEYVRLDRLGDRQDLVMDFGWLGGLSKILLLVLISIHSALVKVSPGWAWGWSIVVITILIKAATWPLTAVQVRSAKRMAKIQQPMAAIREKYKDNPQKMQAEIMELFKKNKVNPAAGCLPLFIYIPVFMSFYAMLRTASELRFASFLWIHDLAAPDTVAHVLGFPINILPLIMTATTAVQMRMTPTPTTDDMQRKIFQFMPLMMLLALYSMPSGMILYWTCQNLLTILQQYLTNRKKDDDLGDPASSGPLKPALAGPGKRR